MTIYVDTSALVALLAREPSHEALAHWLEVRPGSPGLSSLGWGEVVDTAARWVRRGELTSEQGAAFLAAARAFLSDWAWVEVVNADIATAADYIGRDLPRGLKLPDAVHIAVAHRTDSTLLTCDRRQAAAAAAFGISSHLILPERT